jgi:hypothetical protein
MRQAANPFPRGSWIVYSGRVLGVLNRKLIQGPQVIDSTTRILVVLPDDWEFDRQSALSGHSTVTPTPSNPVTESPTTPRPAGPGGVASRNPFSSPSRGQKGPPPKNTASSTLGTTKYSHREATEPTTDADPVTVPSSSTSRSFHPY